ncbi:hypothetical protein BG006_003890 [Podila minutissima]|uniref:Uncharacterized protein n=1 Tax=Podila minutissima TaxID=64525 RepID=A0A9P5SMD4_9FUNG|nr:hypothetical protein BG006_003890 [Podila minutissima]
MLSPEQEYLEAFDTYFPSGETPNPVGYLSGIDSNEEDGPSCTRDSSKRERRSSRSFCSPISPLETPSCSPKSPSSSSSSSSSQKELEAISPAGDGTVTTPPPSVRSSMSAPRRRHNSCVAPNTREFHTLATIFGWVTSSSTSGTWPKRPGRQNSIGGISGNQSESHPSSKGDSGDDSDHDRYPRFGLRKWNSTREPRDPSSLTNCLESPQDPFMSGAIEYLTDYSDSELSNRTPNGRRQNQVQSGWNGRSFISNNGSFSTCFSSRSTTPTTPFSFEVRRNITANVSSLDIPIAPPGTSQYEIEVEPYLADNFERSRRRQMRQLTAERLPQLETTTLTRSSIPQESPKTDSSEAMLMSPLSCTHGKDSGYLSLSYNFLSPPQSIPAVIPEIDTDEMLAHLAIETNDLDMTPDSPLTANTERDRKRLSESTLAPSPPAHQNLPPPIPPRFPEIDAHVFDTMAEDTPDTIVYAPHEPMEAMSGLIDLPPIIAATIVKLIEKLTHQYGMDSGFMADFFLTYRLFMSPVQLCKYLIQRYLWALQEDTEDRCVVRVRTFVVFRYWINNHFADDFLTSKSLRFQMASFLNEMRFNAKVQASQRDSRIIRNLMDFFKYQRRLFKSLAQQSLSAELSQLQMYQSELQQSSAAESRKQSVDLNHMVDSPLSAKTTKSDVTTPTPPKPIKSRHRASTLAGTTSRSIVSEAIGKPSKESRVHYMSRQASEGAVYPGRGRRLSTSSTKSNKSSHTHWSTKVTISINKWRQKSEDLYQLFVHASANGSAHQHYTAKGGENRGHCICWTPAYTGITEHHALNTTRSFPNLRPSVVVSNVFHHDIADSITPHLAQKLSSVSSATSSAAPPAPVPSNKSIKRLKSSLNLGQASSSTCSIPSPVPSPTRHQFSGLSSRHSRSNSNSSTGYHPNPECPYHISSLGMTHKDSSTTAFITSPTQEVSSAENNSHPPMPQPSIPSSPSTHGSVFGPYTPPCSASQPSFPHTIQPAYKPFILFYRSQMIAQQLCLLEQHFLEQVKWNELLEIELTKAGRRGRSKTQSSISGYLFKEEPARSGMDASNERSNMLGMWVASEVVSTQVLEDRVRVIEKFIRIAQKCWQYRNFNSLIQLVMGLGSSHLCGLRKTWARVGGYEMRVLQHLQDFISPCKNWNVIRRAMSQVGQQDLEEGGSCVGSGGGSSQHHQHPLQQRSSMSRDSTQMNFTDFNGSGSNASMEGSHNKYLHHQAPLDKQGCIPFLGLFVFDLTHIAVSPSWFLPPAAPTEEDAMSSGPGVKFPVTSRLEPPEPKDLQELVPTGALLVHFYRFQLIAKTIKWFMAFQQRAQKYTFPVDNTLYSKCFLLRVLSDEHVRELADSCETDQG